MTFQIRTLQSDDFNTIMHLEETVFAADGEATLGQYYTRLCCDFFNDSCFIALDKDGKPAGYLLSMVKGRQVYCTTLAVCEEFRGSRVALKLIAAFIERIIDDVDMCWFTVDEDNMPARKLHKVLGATELGVRANFYGEGEPRIVSQIDKATLARMRPKYERLGLVPKSKVALSEAA